MFEEDIVEFNDEQRSNLSEILNGQSNKVQMYIYNY